MIIQDFNENVKKMAAKLAAIQYINYNMILIGR